MVNLLKMPRQNPMNRRTSSSSLASIMVIEFAERKKKTTVSNTITQRFHASLKSKNKLTSLVCST